MKLKTILFIKKSNSKFVIRDENILSKEYNLKRYNFGNAKGITVFPKFIKIFFWLFKNIWKSDIIFSWFCDYHTLLPVLFGKLFRKKIVIVIGGFDAAKVDEIDYGAHQESFRSKIIQLCSNISHLLLPVSKNTERELFRNIKLKEQNKSTVIYNGVDTNIFHNKETIKKKCSIITVGGVNKTSIKRKGIKLFAEAAKHLPIYSFYLVGKCTPEGLQIIEPIVPKNLVITDKISDSKLNKLMHESKIYVQASLHEGFGISLAEAMYCRCVPIVSKKAAIPEVVGNTGYYLHNLAVSELVDKIKKGIKDYQKLNDKARDRIIRNFTLDIREKNLLNRLSKL